ncbi:MAG: hypothetical protein WCA89_01760 [Terracidiphilus sp.]|jgi:hypothetical protein
MKSHLGWTACSVIAALGLMVTALTAEAQTGQNLVINGDFESGNTGFTTGYALGDISGPGAYFIGPNPSTAQGANGDWCNCGDHTTGNGNMMIVNGANSATWPVWEQTVSVAPSTSYTFSYWGAEVDHDSNSLPHLLVRINGRVIGNSIFPEYSPDNGGQWQHYSFTWNSGSSQSADLAIFDQNTDSPWNDFMLDDISFRAVTGSAGGVALPAGNASSSGPITSHAVVVVKDVHEVQIPLKQEEKIALMFIEAIGSMENGCDLHLNRKCSLAELVAGPISQSWAIGRLKYDPARDPNYKYTVTIAGTGWVASATPRRAGLGGFFADDSRGSIADSYYNANGPATTKDTRLGEISISGDLFNVHSH